MKLTIKEKEILEGKKGIGKQKSLQFLYDIGKFSDAQRFIPINYSHIILEDAQKTGEEANIGIEIAKSFLEGVNSFKVPTTVNSLIINPDIINKLELPKKVLDKISKNVEKSKRTYKKFGSIPSYSCTPHYFYPLKFGINVAVTEGEVVLFTNSVIGARSHYETVPSALAAAIVGRVPEYGLHIKENRFGSILINLDKSYENKHILTDSDYGILPLCIEEEIADSIPVWSGLSPNMSLTQLKYFSMGHAISGTKGIFHIIGVTPEAFSKEMAFGTNKIQKKIVIGKKDILSAYNKCSTAENDILDAIIIGCPHCYLKEIINISELLKGKKINYNIRFWVVTNKVCYDLALRMGYVEKIEKAGGKVLYDMCVGNSLISRFHEELSIKNIGTNSPLPALFIPAVSCQKVKTHFLNINECVNSAIKGKVEYEFKRY